MFYFLSSRQVQFRLKMFLDSAQLSLETQKLSLKSEQLGFEMQSIDESNNKHKNKTKNAKELESLVVTTRLKFFVAKKEKNWEPFQTAQLSIDEHRVKMKDESWVHFLSPGISKLHLGKERLIHHTVDIFAALWKCKLRRKQNLAQQQWPWINCFQTAEVVVHSKSLESTQYLLFELCGCESRLICWWEENKEQSKAERWN